MYRAVDERLERDVAVKVLPAGTFTDESARKRFRTEALALSRLNHPNVATIHDFNSEGSVDYLVMELIRGEGIDDRVARGPMPERDIVPIALQLASGLVAAHDQQIVHRDLKPANLRLTRDGHLKILDFGLAKLLAPASTEDKTIEMVESRGLSGTLPYMAPEQVEGLAVDARTDIHAAGAILYEMATGRRPFQASRNSELVSSIVNTVPAAPHLVNAAISERLSETIMRCLEKDPDHRYQSARDLVADLKRQTSRASSNSAEGLPVARRPRRRNVFVTVAVAVLMLLIGAAALLWYRRDESVPSQPAPAADQEIRTLAILPFQAEGSDGVAVGMGLTDTVVTRISRIGGITVRPTRSVRRYSGANVDALAAGRELQVEAVLDGNVRRLGNRVRVTMNLLRVRDGASVWAEELDLAGGDVFELEDAVAAKVAAGLKLRVGTTGRVALTRHYTTSAAAHEAYAQGKELFDGRIGDFENLRAAIPLFKRAVELDPSYALARANLGYAYLWMALFVEPDDTRWLALAKQEIERAAQLDPSLPDIHLARSDLYWSGSEGFRIDLALRELAAAQALDPSRGHSERATLLYHLGFEDQAVAELQRSLEIDPTNGVNRYHYVEGMVALGRHEQALAAAKRFGEDLPVPSLLATGRVDEARALVTRQMVERRGPVPRANAALVAAVRGDRTGAHALAAEALERSVRGNRAYHHITYAVALVHALEGDAAGAVKWLRETVEFGMPNYPMFERDPMLGRVRSSREFGDFMAELKPRWESYRSIAEAR